MTNREITTTSVVPDRLIVLGGGVVGSEMAQAFATLGSKVAVIEPGERLLAREEPFAGEQVQAALAEQGVKLHLRVHAESVNRDGDGLVRVLLDDGSVIAGDEILVAAGRRAVTDDLGLESVGLTPGGPISVDEHLQVPGLPWLYAIGDVNGRSLLTHMGKHQAHVLSELLSGNEDAPALADAPVTRVIFTEPQVAAVGLTLAQASQLGLAAHAYDVPSSSTAGASFHGRATAGTARLVIDEERGVIVGATFTGSDVADWLHAATIAVTAGVPVESLWAAIPAFPTRSEVWLKLLERREAVLAADHAGQQQLVSAA